MIQLWNGQKVYFESAYATYQKLMGIFLEVESDTSEPVRRLQLSCVLYDLVKLAANAEGYAGSCTSCRSPVREFLIERGLVEKTPGGISMSGETKAVTLCTLTYQNDGMVLRMQNPFLTPKIEASINLEGE